MEARAPLPSQPDADAPDATGPASAAGAAATGGGPDLPDLSALPIAGVTRRRLAFLLAAICSVWIVIAFARQVGEASAASARLEAVRTHNAELVAELAALQAEHELIQGEAYIIQQGHGYRLGQPGEIAVTRSKPVRLPPNAPGSAALRLGAVTDTQTPLESWLLLLFGPSR